MKLLYSLLSLLLAFPVAALPLAQVQATLWPRASYAPDLMVAGAQSKAAAAYGRAPDGSALDVGALRELAGEAQVLTPGGWAPYVAREHHGAASAFNRVGPGWSFGNNSIHSSGRSYFFQVHGVAPTQLQAFDLQYNGAEFRRYQALANAAVALPPPPPPPVLPPPPPPVTVPPPPPPPVTPACPPASTVLCPVLERLRKEFSCV